jgi:hypothetical protein
MKIRFWQGNQGVGRKSNVQSRPDRAFRLSQETPDSPSQRLIHAPVVSMAATSLMLGIPFLACSFEALVAMSCYCALDPESANGSVRVCRRRLASAP